MERTKTSNDIPTVPLTALMPGEAGVIHTLPADDILLDHGLYAGGRIRCILRSPLGDPCAYTVAGTTVALRRRDAARITIRESQEHGKAGA